jgi:hypothetical protein
MSSAQVTKGISAYTTLREPEHYHICDSLFRLVIRLYDISSPGSLPRQQRHWAVVTLLETSHVTPTAFSKDWARLPNTYYT